MRVRQLQGGFPGFTLAETAVSLAIGTVLILIVAVFLANAQTAFNSAYGGAFGSVVGEGLTARTVFRKMIRQASSASGTASVAPNGSWIEVRYYSGSGVSSPDRAARFELSGQELLLRTSDLATGETLSLETVCRNVALVAFHLVGDSAQMFLTLNDGTSSQTVNTCAAMRSP
jgi:hypothetical protein